MSDPVAVASARQPARTREPESLGQLLGLMAKQFAKSLPMRIAVMAVIFVGVWVFHTYLLIGPNGGFAPNDGGSIFGGFDVGAAMLGQVLALSGRLLGGSLFWFMLSVTVSSFVAGVRQPGGGFLSGLGEVPGKVGASFASHRLAAMLLGAGAGAMAGGFLGNRFVALLMAVATTFTIAAGDADFSHIILRCVHNDGRKALSKPKRRLSAASADAFLVGFMLASLVFALAFLIPPFLFMLAGVGLLIGAAVVSQNPAAAAGAASVLFALLVFGIARAAHADDGGYAEAGGGFWEWLTSEGAPLAAAMGLTPAMAAALGAIIGVLGPEMGGLFAGGILPTLLTPPRGPGLGVVGGSGPAQCQGGLPNYWIDTATLKLGITDTITAWSGLGPEVSLTLAWGGPDAAPGEFGRGWSLSADGSVSTGDDGSLVASAGGATALFEPQPAQPGQPVVATGADGRSRLLGYPGVWVWEDPDAGISRRFDQLPDGTFGLTSVTDLNGLSVTLQRDQAGRVASLADAAGRRVSFDRDEYGRVTRFVVADGRAASFEYGPSGDLVRSTDLAGITSEYTYDAAGLIVALVVGRDRKTTRFEWAAYPDGPGIASMTDAAGALTRYELLAPEPRTVRVTDAEGRATLYRFESGHLSEETDALCAATRYEYDEAGRVTTVHGPGGTWTTAFDAAGRVAASTDALGRRTTFEYDANGDVVRRMMPDGGVWQFSYDARRNPVGRTSPAGRRSAMTWDERGLLTSETDEAGRTTRFEHDAFGNMITSIAPDGASRRLRYDQAGLRAVEVTDPAGSKTAFEHDANDRLVATRYPDGTEERTLFDCCTEIGHVDEAGATTGVERDPMMRPLIFTGGGSSSVTTYDRTGMMRTLGVGDSTLLWFEYDAAGRPGKVTQADGSTREIGYDAAGQLVRQKAPSGYSIEIMRDAGGRPVRVTDSTGSVIEAGFDAGDRMVWARNARGGVVEVAYDADGLPLAKTEGGRAIAGYEYSAGGLLIGATSAEGGVRYTLDAAGRVGGIAFADGTMAANDFDIRGQLTQVGLPGGVTLDYQYDARGRMTSVAFAGQRIDWDYLPTGELKQEKRSNGVSTSYGWTAGLLSRVTHEKGRAPVYDVTWTFDSHGRAATATGQRPVGPAAASRDALQRDGAGRVTAAGTARVDYDPDGNVVARSGAYDAAYDAENRLTAVSVDGSSTTWDYDGLGRRTKRSGAGGERVYHHDAAGRLLFETDGSGHILAHHVWRGPSLVASVVDGKARFYHTDRNANVVAVTDERGAVIAAYDYDAFGAVTASTGAAADQPYRFMGSAGVTAEAGGLYATGSRFYDPVISQFLSKDPAGMQGTLEPWEYCQGDPVNMFDATGFEGQGYPGALKNVPFSERDNPNSQFQWKQSYDNQIKPSAPSTPIGGEKVVSGGVNLGWGAYASYGAGGMLIAGFTGAVSMSPLGAVGWTLLLFAGLSRTYAGQKSLKGGINGETFTPSQNPIIETIDPGGLRNLPGYLWGGVCNMASGVKDGVTGAYHTAQRFVGHCANPRNFMPGPGGYPGGGGYSMPYGR